MPGQIPCHYSRKPAGGRKYVEMDWNPLYPFGYGLSYTTFSFENLRLSASEIHGDESLEVLLDVTTQAAVPEQRWRRFMSMTIIHPWYARLWS